MSRRETFLCYLERSQNTAPASALKMVITYHAYIPLFDDVTSTESIERSLTDCFSSLRYVYSLYKESPVPP